MIDSDWEKLLVLNRLDPAFLAEKLFIFKIKTAWQDIVGPLYYPYSEPVAIKNGKLMVFVEHVAYQMELAMNETRILKLINDLLGSRSIFRLIYSVKMLQKPPLPTEKLPEGSLDGKENLVSLIQDENDAEIKKKLLDLIRVL